MYNLKLDAEMVDKIFKDVLVQDYKRICKFINQIKDTETLEDYQKEDLENDKHFKSGFEILLDYYFTTDEASEIKKDANNV
jgi:hypothetical protein